MAVPSLREAFKALPSTARSALRDLRSAEKSYWPDSRATQMLLSAAAIMLDYQPSQDAPGDEVARLGGLPKPLRAFTIGWIIESAARAKIEDIAAEMYAPDEPDKGGRRVDSWWTVEREDGLMEAFRDVKKIESTSLYKKAVAHFRLLYPEANDKFPDNNPIETRYRALLEAERKLDELIEDFDDEPEPPNAQSSSNE